MFVRQIVSDIRSWNPSVHHIRDKILFASADDVNIETKRGKISGAKVILQLNSSNTPYKTEMTMTTNRNGAFCAQVAQDLRTNGYKSHVIGVIFMLFDDARL